MYRTPGLALRVVGGAPKGRSGGLGAPRGNDRNIGGPKCFGSTVKNTCATEVAVNCLSAGRRFAWVAEAATQACVAGMTGPRADLTVSAGSAAEPFLAGPGQRSKTLQYVCTLR